MNQEHTFTLSSYRGVYIQNYSIALVYFDSHSRRVAEWPGTNQIVTCTCWSELVPRWAPGNSRRACGPRESWSFVTFFIREVNTDYVCRRSLTGLLYFCNWIKCQDSVSRYSAKTSLSSLLSSTSCLFSYLANFFPAFRVIRACWIR